MLIKRSIKLISKCLRIEFSSFLIYLMETRHLGNERSCSICLDNVEIGKISQCKHEFHSDCIKEWIVAKNKRNCPVCREKLKANLKRFFNTTPKTKLTNSLLSWKGETYKSIKHTSLITQYLNLDN